MENANYRLIIKLEGEPTILKTVKNTEILDYLNFNSDSGLYENVRHIILNNIPNHEKALSIELRCDFYKPGYNPTVHLAKKDMSDSVLYNLKIRPILDYIYDAERGLKKLAA